MKMKQLFFACCLVFIMQPVLGQSELSVKLSPLRLFHPTTAMMPVALEFKKGNFTMEYEHGFKINSFFLDWNSTKSNQHYFRSQFTLGYYFKNDNLKHFIGLSFSYLPHSYMKHSDWYIKEENRYWYLSSNVSVDQFKYRAIYGLKIPIKGPIYMEFRTGVGVSSQNISYQTMNETVANEEHLWDEWISPRDRVAAKTIKPSVLMSIRIGYILFATNSKKP